MAGDYLQDPFAGLVDPGTQQVPAGRPPLPEEEEAAFLEAMRRNALGIPQGPDVGVPPPPQNVGPLGMAERLGELSQELPPEGPPAPDMGAAPPELLRGEPDDLSPLEPEYDTPLEPEYDTLEGTLHRRAELTPEERMKEDVLRADERDRATQASREEKVRADANQQAANLLAFQHNNERAQAKTMQLMQRAEEVSQKEVDPRRWFKSRSLGQHLATTLAAAIGGALNPGGPNITLQMAQKQIDADINAQVASLEAEQGAIKTQQGLVAQLYGQGMTAHQAAESARIAVYSRMEQDLAAEAARFDPMGTTVRRLEEGAMGLAERKAEAARSLAKNEFDTLMALDENERKRQEQKRKNLETASQNLKRSLESGLLERKLNRTGGGGGAGAAGRLSPETWVQMYPDLASPPPVPMNEEEFGKYLTTLGKVKGLERSESDLANTKLRSDMISLKKAETLRVLGAPDPARKGDPLLMKDGTEFLFKSPEEAKRMRLVMSGAQKMRSGVDKMKALIRDKGGSSDILKSKEWQQAKALVTSVDMDNAVNLGLGAISKDDLVQLVSFRGGVDPTSFLRDATAGLESMADIFEEGVNYKLYGQGWDSDEPWRASRRNIDVAHERPTDELLQAPSIPEVFKDDDGKRAEYIKNAKENYEVAGVRDDTGVDEAARAAKGLAEAEARGDITESEAAGLGAVIHDKVVGRLESEVEKQKGYKRVTDPLGTMLGKHKEKKGKKLTDREKYEMVRDLGGRQPTRAGHEESDSGALSKKELIDKRDALFDMRQRVQGKGKTFGDLSESEQAELRAPGMPQLSPEIPAEQAVQIAEAHREQAFREAEQELANKTWGDLSPAEQDKLRVPGMPNPSTAMKLSDVKRMVDNMPTADVKTFEKAMDELDTKNDRIRRKRADKELDARNEKIRKKRKRKGRK